MKKSLVYWLVIRNISFYISFLSSSPSPLYFTFLLPPFISFSLSFPLTLLLSTDSHFFVPTFPSLFLASRKVISSASICNVFQPSVLVPPDPINSTNLGYTFPVHSHFVQTRRSSPMLEGP